MIKSLIFSLIFIAVGCSRSPTINLRPRTFGENPKNVIWIQVPGFELEHSAMLRFGSSDSRTLTSIEDVDCVGSAWSYNFYQLRTNADESTMSQITGSADIKNSCPSDNRFPVWQYYKSLGFQTLAVEVGTNSKNSLSAHSQCNENTFMEGVTLLQMQQSSTKVDEDKLFHYQSKKSLAKEGLYFDQTCQNKNSSCFATLSNNIQTMWSEFSNQTKGTFFYIRDFRYLNYLKSGDIKKAREVLSEINKVVAYFKSQPSSSQSLILITGGETQSLKMPTRGKEWKDFEKLGRNVRSERSRLNSPVLAKGPSAENFCGVYEESKLLARHFWRDDNKILSIDKFTELMKF